MKILQIILKYYVVFNLFLNYNIMGIIEYLIFFHD